MSFWERLFGGGGGGRPEETIRLTRRAMDLLAEGLSDEDAVRTLHREGASPDRARAVVAEVRRLRER